MSRVQLQPVPPSPYRYRSGLHYGTQGSTTTTVLSNQSLRLAPFMVDRPQTWDRIACEITGAGEVGSTLRMAVYHDDGTGYPGSLLLDAGTVAADAVANVSVTINLTTAPGLYWVGAVAQAAPTTGPTVRAFVATFIPAAVGMTGVATLNAGYTQASVAGAAPATFTTTVTNGTPPRVVLRAA